MRYRRGKWQGARGKGEIRARSRLAPRPSPLAPGFTIIEMAVSMAIIAIVLVALGSVVVLSSRALDATNTGSAMQSAQARGIVDQLASDMKMAIAFSEHTANAATFTVP